MPRRRYRRSPSSQIVGDAAFIANRLPWWGAALVGVVSFVLFYWLVPLWLRGHIEAMGESVTRPAVEAIVGRRIHLFQYLAIAIALVCGFFAIRNYLHPFRLRGRSESNAGFFSRVLARLLD